MLGANLPPGIPPPLAHLGEAVNAGRATTSTVHFAPIRQPFQNDDCPPPQDQEPSAPAGPQPKALPWHGRSARAKLLADQEAEAGVVIVDCHVNIWEDRHLTPLFAAQMARVRPGGMGLKADADTLYEAMRGVDKAIVFALRYGDSAGVESDDETAADAVRRYPDKFVGFAYADPRRADCMELLRHASSNLGLRGVKYGPIYNGVPLADPRMTPIYEHCVEHDLPLTMHMGTTFARNAPVDLGRAIHVEPVALRYPTSRSFSPTWATPGTRTRSRWCASSRTSTPRSRRFLPALAVLERHDQRPGISGHRQDLLRHRLSVLDRRGLLAGFRAVNAVAWAQACRGSAPRSSRASSTPTPSSTGGTDHRPSEPSQRGFVVGS